MTHKWTSALTRHLEDERRPAPCLLDARFCVRRSRRVAHAASIRLCLSAGLGTCGYVGRVPGRYRLRLHGRTLTVWDTDPSHAGHMAQEWLDFSDKAGVDPLAAISVEPIIGDTPMDSDLLGTLEDVRPTHTALAASVPRSTPHWWEPALVRVVSLVRRLFVPIQSSSTDD